MAARSTPPRSSAVRFGLALAALALPLSACTGGGPGDQDDLVAALTRDDTFTEGQAECIAEAVFAEYGENEDALGAISGAVSYDEISAVEGLDDFDQFFTNVVKGCTI